MKKKASYPGFNAIILLLRHHGFEVGHTNGPEGSVLVSKACAGAILTPGASGPEFVVRPGAMVQGEVARLLDRGYQKFLVTPQMEVPATAEHLAAIQAFSSELKELVGGTSLYNESLGTTSDRYMYDRVEGRESDEQKGPEKLTSGH